MTNGSLRKKEQVSLAPANAISGVYSPDTENKGILVWYPNNEGNRGTASSKRRNIG